MLRQALGRLRSVAAGDATWGALPSTSAIAREPPSLVPPSSPSPGDRMPRGTGGGRGAGRSLGYGGGKGAGGIRASTAPAPLTRRLPPLTDLDSDTSAAVSALKATPSSELNDLGGRFEALSSFIQRARKDDCTVTVGQSSNLQQSLLKGPPGSTPVLLERLAATA